MPCIPISVLGDVDHIEIIETKSRTAQGEDETIRKRMS